MIGICIELKTECKYCSHPLMMNALTEKILCPACNKFNSFTSETWQGLLEDSLKEAPKFKLGEGQPSTIMRGEYKYNLLYGRQEPRCSKCKQNIDVSKIEEYSNNNNLSCSKCSNSIYVRKLPAFAAAIFPDVKYLIGEDADLIESKQTKEKLPDSSKPILFTCPSCAGNLQIDGNERLITCKFCNSQIYLPDDFWFRLHPANEVERWYILYDDKVLNDKLPEWYYIPDLTIDRDGNGYAATSDDETGFIVWSFSPGLKTRWIRKGLKFDNEKTGLSLTNDGNLYLYGSNKHSLLKLSAKDGSTIKIIEGSPSNDDNPFSFDLKGCTSLVSDTDGTILVLVNNKIVRYSEDGKRVQLWKGKSFGIFSSGIGDKIPENDEEWTPCVKGIHSHPKKVDSDFTKLNIGWDGYLYMIDRSSDGVAARYDRDGNKVISVYIPLTYKDCKACADKEGNIYIIGMKEDNNTNLIRISSNGNRIDTLLTDIKEGGVLDEEDQITLGQDGKIYIYKYYNRMKIFSPDLKMIFRSKQSEKDDNEVLKKKKEAIENDEEFN